MEYDEKLRPSCSIIALAAIRAMSMKPNTKSITMPRPILRRINAKEIEIMIITPPKYARIIQMAMISLKRLTSNSSCL